MNKLDCGMVSLILKIQQAMERGDIWVYVLFGVQPLKI